MIECQRCGCKWNVQWLVAKGKSRCPHCNAELDVSAFLVEEIGGASAVRDLRERLARVN